jgi:hypothetical protein
VRLRRVLAQDAVDRRLRLLHAAFGEERHPEQVRHRAVLARAPGQGREDLDHAGALPEAEAAVGEEEGGGDVVGLRRVEPLGLLRRVRDASRLGVGEREVAADRGVRGVEGERLLVLPDRVVVAPVLCVGGAEVGPEDRALSPEGEDLLVERRRSRSVAALVQGHRAGEERVRGRSGRLPADGVFGGSLGPRESGSAQHGGESQGGKPEHARAGPWRRPDEPIIVARCRLIG